MREIKVLELKEKELIKNTSIIPYLNCLILSFNSTALSLKFNNRKMKIKSSLS
jgi:hypothetical protein